MDVVFVFVVLGMEQRASNILRKCSSTELCPQPCGQFLTSVLVFQLLCVSPDACMLMGVLIACVGFLSLSVGGPDCRVLTCMAIILKGPWAWRWRVVDEGPKSRVSLDQVEVDVDGELGWAPTGRCQLLPVGRA